MGTSRTGRPKNQVGKASRKKTAGWDPALQRRLQDIVGIGLIFLGLAGFVSLLQPEHAPIPELLDAGLRLLAGSGAYAIVGVIVLLGVMVLRGFQRLQLTLSSLGLFLLFLTFVAWRHLLLVPDAALDPVRMKEAGGWLGGLVGWMLYTLLRRPLSYLALGMMLLVSCVLIVDRPLAELIAHLHERSLKAVAQALWQKIAHMRAAPRVLSTPSSRSRNATPTAIPPLQKTLPVERKPQTEEQRAVVRVTAPSNVPKPEQEKLARHFPNPFQLLRRSEPDNKEEAAAASPAETAPASPTALPAPCSTSAFALPPLTLLKEPAAPSARRGSEEKGAGLEQADRIRTIEATLEQFNIGASVVEVASGPTVTRYEIQLAPGIKVSKIVSLADNLAMSLAAIDVRVEAPIPGKSAIGLEVPNLNPSVVTLRECLDTDEFRNAPSKLTVALGKDVSGQCRYADLAKMPHLLIGGSTNSGKSICLNCLIASLVYRATPSEVRLLMVDPKRVELSLWDGIPHLLHPVVKDVKQAAGLFHTALREMDRRYDLFARMGSRNIDSYNEKVSPEERLPYIVLIVDELADLMLQHGAEVENSICRLAQLARATGIHLVIATQRPSVDIITGTIKANISSRIAFAVASQVDSRTILDMPGAERLIGRGDMLFMPIDAPKPIRIQGCYLSEQETQALVDYLKQQPSPGDTLTITEYDGKEGAQERLFEEDDVDERLFAQAVRLVVNNGQASTSMLQRRFRIGYTRAARIVEMMEERGIVGPLSGARPREILISRDEAERLLAGEGPGSGVSGFEPEREDQN
ncbi:DNA translocase FtsK [Chthonomonas calidirosea]|uniref:DNA translocase FtsK n=1 Tax=Chthonomonas calidirosea TaxID=454171 RepID=UPI0006EC68C5|nr:DNA translocase FtsK [Chthonomonas calidirosea]CEK17721.1 DNA translocase FtsK [Chthonomonas calidirosea]